MDTLKKKTRAAYSRSIVNQQKEVRRIAGEKRNAEYAKLPPEQKLAKLDTGGFRALKQRKQLAAQLTK